MNIDQTLTERGKIYGEYSQVARVSQNIKAAIEDSTNWPHLDPEKRETMHMIANKLARILNGDQNDKDSWHDIIGYATLIQDRLKCQTQGKGQDFGGNSLNL